jgi:hypothetical protein
VFIEYSKYLGRGLNEQKSQPVVVDKFRHKLWLEVHEEKAKEASEVRK